MANVYIDVPVRGAIPYANLAAFPASAAQGAQAVAIDTDTFYFFNGTTWVSIGGPGSITSVGAFDTNPNAAGLLETSGAIALTAADATRPGGVSTGAQTFGGAKTFSSVISSGETSASNFNFGQQQIVSSGTPIVLTASSPYETVITGSSSQTVTMPVVSTLTLGKRFRITTLTGNAVITVQSSGGNTIGLMVGYGPNISSAEFVCVLVTGTTVASWAIASGSVFADRNDTTNNKICFPIMRYTEVGLGLGPSLISSNLTLNTSTGILYSKNYASGYSTTATSSSVTTLTVGSNRKQFFTGSQVQNCDLPLASTVANLGLEFEIINLSTGVVTVRSSGANVVQAMAANTRAIIKCILASGTTASSWQVTYMPLPTAISGTGSAILADGCTIGANAIASVQGYSPINVQTGTTYTLVLADAGKMVTMDNASPIALTVPTNASVPFVIGTEIDLAQLGAGKVTISGAGVTFNSLNSFLGFSGQYAGVTLKKIATDTWLVVGSLAA